jgi:hypothetical protein
MAMIKDKLDLIASARLFDVRKVSHGWDDDAYEIGAWGKGLVAHISSDRSITYYYQDEDYEGDRIRYEINAEEFMRLKHFCELMVEE